MSTATIIAFLIGLSIGGTLGFMLAAMFASNIEEHRE